MGRNAVGAWAIAFLCMLVGDSWADIRIGSFDLARSERPFATSPDYSNIRSRLLNPANFGPGGVVPEPVAIVPGVAAVTAANLADLDLFVVSEVGSLSVSEINDLRQFALSGRCLILASNSSSTGWPGSNLMLQALDGGAVGNPTGGDNGANVGTIVAAGASTNGPFGNLPINSTFAATLSGSLFPGSSTTIIGRTSLNTFNMLGEIPKGALGAGSGGVLVMADVLAMNFFVPPATFAGNENNATLFMNFVAAHIPEPGSLVVVLSALPMLLRRKSRSRDRA